MPAQLLEGAPLAAAMRAELARDIAALKAKGRPLCLAGVLVGQPPGSVLYVKNQRKQCEDLGLDYSLVQLPETVTQPELEHALEQLNRDPAVHGIILQVPLPARLDAQRAQRAIDPRKDAEGVHPLNLGLILYGATQRAPCTAMAAYHLIKSLGQDLRGKEAVVVGRSQIVGRPLGLLLLNDSCTVTTCHTGTRDLGAHCRQADILAVAVGKPHLIGKDLIKPGAIVVDVGVNRVPVTDGAGRPVLNARGEPRFRVVGDVDFEAAREVAGWITPVPGGVGPLTVMALLRNVVEAGKQALS